MQTVWRMALSLSLILAAFSHAIAASPEDGKSFAPLTQGAEFDRFLHDVPFFLRWARGQGLEFEVYPKAETLFAPPRGETTRAALENAGWGPERFAFLLCATGAAATSTQASCGRALTIQEWSLLEGRMLELMDAYGTGP